MEQKQYPAFLNTKEDYEFVVNNFSRDFWEEDLLNLYADALYCEPIGTRKIEDGVPNTELLVDEPDEETICTWHKKYDSMDYQFIEKTNDDIEIRQYEGEPFQTLVKIICKPGSKAATLGIDISWLEKVAIFEGKEEYEKYNALLQQISEENKEIQKTIDRLGGIEND